MSSSSILNYIRQLGKDSLVYGIAAITTRLVTIILVPFYTRVFTVEEYGIMTLVTSAFSLVLIFIVLGLDAASWRWYYNTEEDPAAFPSAAADRRKTIGSWIWCQLAVAAVFGLFIFLAAGWLAATLTGYPPAHWFFRLSALNLPFTVLSTVVVNWLRFEHRPVATILFTLLTSVMTIALTIFLISGLHWGLEGVYFAQLATSAAGTILAAWLMRDWLSPRYFSFARLREMLHYALPLVPAGAATWAVSLSGRYFIQFYSTTSDVGVYQLGATVSMLVALVVAAFQQAWGPFSLSIHKKPEAHRIYAIVFMVYVWAAALFSAALALFAPEVVRLLATSAYQNATLVIGILAFGQVFNGLVYIATIGPAIARSMAANGRALIIAAALNILLNFALVPSMGNLGAAAATLVSQMIVPLYVFYYGQKIYPIPYRFGPAAALMLLSAAITWAGGQFAASNNSPAGIYSALAVKLLLLAILAASPLYLKIITPKQITAAWKQML